MSTLKTSPLHGTYYPMRVPVEGCGLQYLVPVKMWHDTEHDANCAHEFESALARKDAALKMAVEGLVWCDVCACGSEDRRGNEVGKPHVAEQECPACAALTACREAIGAPKTEV